MPARVVDGDGLWRSKKLKSVEQRYRAEYANLLPLAEANGVFDCDPDRIWSDVYAFNRIEVTVEMVEEILDEFERVDLLRRWSEKGKTWGYWTGINKSGRLPTEAHIKRYKNLPPNPPPGFSTSDNQSGTGPELSGIIRDNPGEVRSTPVGFGIGIGLVLDRNGIGEEDANPSLESFEKEEDTDMKSEKLIAIHSQTILRVPADLNPTTKLMLAGLDAQHKGSVVARQFEVWAKEHKHDEIRKPVSAFLKEASDLLESDGSTSLSEENAVVKKASREIAYITDNQVSFSAKQKDILKVAVEEEDYTYDDLLGAFRDFFQKMDTSNSRSLSFAPKEFSESAGDLMYAVHRKRAEKALQDAAVASKAAEMQAEAERERVERLVAKEREQELVEDELPD